MTKEICQELFENLYKNKIIFFPSPGPYCFCEFLKSEFNNNTLTVRFKIIESAVKLKPRYKIWFEKARSKDFIKIQYHFLINKTIEIEKQSIGGIYSPRIWTNYDIVKKAYELKEQNLENEIYNILW